MVNKDKDNVFMAQYDEKHDKIIGCEKGSFVWWHERGHQILCKKPIYKNIEWIWSFLLLFSFTNVCIALNKPLITYPFLIFLSSILAIEIYAWVFAFRNYKRK